MKLSTRFFIGSVIVALLASVAGLVFIFVDRQVNRTFEKSKAVDEMTSGAVELSILTSEYLLSPTERANVQWQSKNAATLALLDTIAFSDSEEQVILQNVRRGLENIQTLFSELVKNQSETGAESLDVRQQRNQRLAGQISVELQKMLTLTAQLKQVNQRETASAQQISSFTRYGLLALLLVAVITVPLIMNFGVIRPVLSLTRVAEEISRGNLSVEIPGTEKKDEIGILTRTFEQMTTQLRNTLEDLEQRVADRTKALATSAEVSRRLSIATNPAQLAADVVEQVQSAFNYYHVHIYFVDEASGDLVMTGGSGEAGAAMLARGHKIPKGRGLVGRAAGSNVPVLVPDVTQAEGWLPNPLLPDTKSEAAIPIASGSTVLGVLDVQQNIVNGLDEEDVSLLQSLAGQIAISLQNARAFEQSKAQAELESLVNAIGQKIQRAATVDDTLQTAIREIGLALGASRVSANIQAGVLEDNGKGG